MAEFVEVIRQRNRMTRNCSISCCDCDLSLYRNSTSMPCECFSSDNSEEYEKIVMDWAKEHPAMTNADKFKEIMKKTFGLDIPIIFNLIGCNVIDCPSHNNCSECEFDNFWEKEYKEPSKE